MSFSVESGIDAVGANSDVPEPTGSETGSSVAVESEHGPSHIHASNIFEVEEMDSVCSNSHPCIYIANQTR